MSLLLKCRNDAEVDALLARCMYSTEICALTFWPELLEDPICSSHRDLLKILDTPKPRQKVVIKGTRKGGKTTWLKLFVARCLLFRLKRFIFYISQSESHAMITTEAIKRMLVHNKLIRTLKTSNGKMPFGDIREHDAEFVDREFSKKGWVAQFPGDHGTFDGTLVVPRGAGQQVRGILFDRYTPDLIVVDDLEKKDTITNELIRGANWDYTISDVARCFSQTKDDWQMVYLDTLKHEDSVIARLFGTKAGWEKHEMPLCVEDSNTNSGYRTLMEPFISQERVDAMVYEARENGDLDEFARECMCRAISTEAAKFRQEYFKHYQEHEPIAQGEVCVADQTEIQNIILCDPAKTTGDKSCKSAIVVWGIDQARRRFYLRHVDKGRYHPSQLIDRYLDYCERFKCTVGGVEVTGLEEFIKWPMQQAMIERNIFTNIVWCKARGKKENRAGMLESIYRRGQVWHNRDIANLIEPTLLSYPRPAEWDVLDAAAYLFAVIEEGKAYLVGGEKDSPDETDEQAFAELDRRDRLDDLDYGFGSNELRSYYAGEYRWMHDRTLSRN